MTNKNDLTNLVYVYYRIYFRADTHKGDVLRYCSTKADEATVDLTIPDRMSYSLLWNLLSLLVRSNGQAEGHEYAELLLGGTFEKRQQVQVMRHLNRHFLL